MSYCEDQPVCASTCRCGYWDPCPGYPWTQFRNQWWRIGCAHVAAQDGTPPTRWQRARERFRLLLGTRVPNMRVVRRTA